MLSKERMFKTLSPSAQPGEFQQSSAMHYHTCACAASIPAHFFDATARIEDFIRTVC
jgi:hypothetical protein